MTGHRDYDLTDAPVIDPVFADLQDLTAAHERLRTAARAVLEAWERRDIAGLGEGSVALTALREALSDPADAKTDGYEGAPL
ncbi:MAG: hypothetical protein KIS96_11410 [Bauldia sp.]|mgnify:CR=1 FL=1|nr:hypothetical protein [Bauldia sp.]